MFIYVCPFVRICPFHQLKSSFLVCILRTPCASCLHLECFFVLFACFLSASCLYLTCCLPVFCVVIMSLPVRTSCLVLYSLSVSSFCILPVCCLLLVWNLHALFVSYLNASCISECLEKKKHIDR